MTDRGEETVRSDNYLTHKALVNVSEPCKDTLFRSQHMQIAMQVALV